MKRKIDFLIVALFAVVLFASCERVAPNYAGVCSYKNASIVEANE